MNALETRSPRMGWLGVQTCCNTIFCWRCASSRRHHGAMLTPEDVLADDRCDLCGVVLLTGTRQLTDACSGTGLPAASDASWEDAFSRFREEAAAEYQQASRGIRLRKLRWHECLRRWLTITE